MYAPIYVRICLFFSQVRTHEYAARQRLHISLYRVHLLLHLRALGFHRGLQGVSAAASGVPLHAQDCDVPAVPRLPASPRADCQLHLGPDRRHPLSAAILPAGLR